MSTHIFEFEFWRLFGGAVFWPYKMALGISLRLWYDAGRMFMPSIRLHVGPFELWCKVVL